MLKSIRMIVGLCAALVITTAASHSWGQTGEGPIEITKDYTMAGGLPVSITAIGMAKHRAAVNSVFDYSFNEVNTVATKLDPTNPLSEISQVNLQAGNIAVPVSAEFIKLMGLIKKVNTWTNGYFDIVTSSPFTFDAIKVSEGKSTIHFTKPGVQIDLSFIRDGFLADLLLISVYNSKIDNAMVKVGNAYRSIGKDVVGPWKVSVKNPGGRYANRGIALTFSGLSTATVNTDHEPTIHPKTKKPLLPLAKSVTVLARDAATAQAIASAIYILGPTEGMALVTKLQNVRAVITDADGNFIRSPGL